jgi:hypothetical protein
MMSVYPVPPYLHVPGSKFRRHGHLRLPLTMLAVASLALSSLLFLAPIPVQAAPTAAPDTYDTDEDTILVEPAPGVLENDDPDPVYPDDELTAHLVSNVSHGTLALSSDGSFTYTPNAAFNGIDSFTYETRDNQYPPASAPAMVTITVNATEAYELTIINNNPFGGSVTTPGEGTFSPYDDGEEVTLVAQPNPFWGFTEWTGSGVDADAVADPDQASTTIIMNADYAVHANFAWRRHTLTIGSTEGGSVIDPGEGDFTRERDTVVALLAEPEFGYEFQQWTGDFPGRQIGDASEPSTTITVRGDYSITANFVAIDYTLTIDSTVGGSVTTPGEGTFGPFGVHQQVSLVADPDPEYSFYQWVGDTDTMADNQAAQTTITMDGNYSITAQFAQQYSLTIDVSPADDPATPERENLGWPNLDIGTHWYDPGTVVEIEGWPETEIRCQFDGWTGSGVEADAVADPDQARTTITMNGNYSITANFSRLPPVETFFLYVHVEPKGTGSTNPEEGRHYFDEGELIDIDATPADGWAFGGWTTDEGVDLGAVEDPNAASTTITMNYNYHVTANFVQGVAYDQMVTTSEDTPVEIILMASNLGGDALTFSIVDAPAHGRLSGAPPNLTYTPDEGYTGSDSFTFSVDDGTNDSNTATVTITVEAAGTGAESDPDGMGVPTWVWIPLAGGSIAVGAITLLVIARRSAATE